MSAEDELAIPEIPEAKPDDPEDVSWSLSTAEAMWARGDHLEGIKWVRKAAEAASDTDNDVRALELAKAASELTTLIARRSRASMGDGSGGYAGGAPPDPAQAPRQNHPSARPVPQSSAPPAPGTKSAAPVARSVPPAPIPLPSRASSAPRAPQVPSAARGAPRPLATSEAPRAPQPGGAGVGDRSSTEPPAKSSRGRRRSRENLDADAMQAAVLETAPQTAVDGTTAEHALVRDDLAVTTVGTAIDIPSPSTRARRRSRPEPEATVVTNVADLVGATRQKSVAEWDASPTQNLTGAEMEHNINAGDRATTAVPFVTARPSPSPSPLPPARAPATTVHDPEIQTSQAVHVVVWRDAHGVHIAPSGTVVSAITIDAVLVALEPSADLTAWLSQRER